MSLISPFARKLWSDDLKKIDSDSYTYKPCANIEEAIEKQIAELQKNVSRKIRSDAARAIEYQIKFDQTFTDCGFEEKMKEFYKNTMRFFNRLHSSERVIAAG